MAVSLKRAQGVPQEMVSLKRFAEITRTTAEDERRHKEDRWSDVRDFFAPNRLRLEEEDNTQEEEVDDAKIINNTGKLAGRALKAGFMSGVTSPARDWVKVTTSDPNLLELGHVKKWLENLTKQIANIFIRSNLYQVLPNVYGDAGFFATGGMLILEDFEKVIKCVSVPLGTYSLGQDQDGNINVFTRNYRKTVRQIVEEFLIDFPGDRIRWERASGSVKEMFDAGNHGEYVLLRHVIMPNIDYNPNIPGSKKFLSLYYEAATGSGKQHLENDENDKFLRNSGFDYFPFLAFRWDKAGDGVWGNDCPGWDALGDNMQLQELEKDSLQVVASHARPAMQGPTSLEHKGASIVPGDSTWYNVREGVAGFRKVFEQRMELDTLDNKMEKVEARIDEAFYKNLFLAITELERGVTATEVLERKQEKLLALGPALERINEDLLNKLIDITVILMDSQDLIEDVPRELAGKELKVEYISVLHQAQKSSGLEPLERLTQFVGSVAALTGTVPKTFNPEGITREYADRVGSSTNATFTEEEVQDMVIREQQALAAQAQQQALLDNSMAAKNLSQANIAPENALGAAIEGIQQTS
jgi:hypothetical protein